MKVGIITMHRLHNYGSFLQAFALKKIVEGYGHSCTFVEYKKEKNHSLKKVKYKFFWIIRNIKRLLKYNINLHKVAKWRHQIKDMFEEEITRSLIGQEHYSEYDLLIVGSDEVFNFTDNILGYRPALLGHGINKKKIVSYAASCGYTTYDRIVKRGITEQIRRNLNEFAELSVRDNNTLTILKKIVDKDVFISLDPVFIYDYGQFKQEKKYSDYILIYSYLERIKEKKIIQEIKKIAKKKNLIIISTFSYYEWCDYNLIATPQDLLSLFKYADYIFTDTFHGNVLAIKENKKFLTIVRESNYEKLFYILQKIGLEKRIINNPEDIEITIDSPIDYRYVNEVIMKERQISIEYINKILLED